MHPEPKLCAIVEGVEFTVAAGGEPVRAVVSRELLDVRFGRGPEPEAWLGTFLDHRQELEAAAVARWRSCPGQTVVLTAAGPVEDATPSRRDREDR